MSARSAQRTRWRRWRMGWDIGIGYKNIPVNLGGAPKAIQISGT